MTIAITTTSLITGSTNTDGTGSAANLTVENGHEIDLDHYTTFDDYGNTDGKWTIVDGDTTIEDSFNRYGDNRVSITNTADWNDDGEKEISIDTADFDFLNDSDYLTISNYVDVDLRVADIDHNGELMINIEGTKRGTIDLSDNDGASELSIAAKSNSDHWGNMFKVTGSNYQDSVSIGTGGNDGTQYTEFSMDLAGGDDTFSCTLYSAKSDSQTRFVDGGEGVDTITVCSTESGNHSDTVTDVDFVNFEIINARYVDNLILNEDILEKNGTEDSPLTVKNATEIDFAGDVESISAVETDYINEHGRPEDGYYEVTVDYADASYTVITDSVDDSWLA